MTERTPLTPQDLLADGVEGTVVNGTYIRKGSIAAFIQNVKMLQDTPSGTPQYHAIAEQIRTVKPALDALDMFDVFELRDRRVCDILRGEY